MEQLETELEADFPAMDFEIIGVNEFGQESGNDLITENLAWLQDVDANGDSQSDVWDLWDVTYRDVIVLNDANEQFGVFNVTVNNLADSSNFDALRQMFVDAAAHSHSDLLPNYDPTSAYDFNADLMIWVNGQQVTIPEGVGDTVGFQSTDDVGNLRFNPNVVNPGSSTEFATLNDFFGAWRNDPEDQNPDAVFNKDQLLNNVVDATHSVQMFVNGERSTEFGDYKVQPGDRIVLAYTSNPIVAMEYNTGSVLVELDRNAVTDASRLRAGETGPVDVSGHVENLLDIVNQDQYDRSIVHRSDPGFVIQGGGFTSATGNVADIDQIGAVTQRPTVTNEPGASNLRGTISLARGGAVSSGTTEYFFNLSNNQGLDTQEPPPGSDATPAENGFTAFGQVLDMAPVDEIAALTISDEISTNVFTGNLAAVTGANTTALGRVALTFNPATEEFIIDVFVEGLALADLTGSSLQTGALGAAGTQIFDLGDNSQWVEDSGGLRRTISMAAFPTANVADLTSEQVFINVQSTSNPDGDVGARLGRRTLNSGVGNPPVTADSQFVVLEDVTGGGTIRGFVFVDVNADDALDAGDTRLSNQTVFIDDNNNGQLDDGETSTTTAADGSYFFHVESGTYTLRQVAALNFTQSSPTGPDSHTVTIEIGGIRTNVDFGNRPEFNNSIEGSVYFDANNNGVFDPNEIGIGGVTVTLTGTDDRGNAVNLTQETDSDGSYRFANLAPGTYTATETQPGFLKDGIDTLGTLGGDDSVNDEFSAIGLPDGSEGKGYNFAERGPSDTFARLADFIVTRAELENFGTRYNNAILAAVDINNGQVWSSMGPGWGAFASSNTTVSADETTYTLSVTDSGGNEQSTTVPQGDDKLTMIGRVGDILLIRLNGDRSAFTFNEAANTFSVNENSAAGTVVGQLTSANAQLFEMDDPNRADELNLAPDDHLAGNLSAPIVLIEYLDFQCGHCAANHPIVEQLKRDFPDDLLVVSRYFPLTQIFANSLAAARAAEAAGRQGAFEQMKHLLFTRQDDWNGLADPQATFEGYATELALDLAQFQADVADPTIDARINRDANGGAALGVTGTPTFFLDGTRIDTPSDLAAFSALIQAEVDSNGDVFRMDRQTGELTVNDSEALDFETMPTFLLPINATNGTTTQITAAVNLNNVAD